MKGRLATSLEEMLGYQQSRKQSLTDSGKIRAGKFGSDCTKSKYSCSSKNSQRSNRTHRGRSGSPGFITVDGVTPLKTDSVVKAECAVVAENDLPAQIETPICSEHGTEVKAESPVAAEIDSPIKIETPTQYEAEVEVKVRSVVVPENDLPTKIETPVDSGHNIEVKAESPSVFDQNIKEESLSVSDHQLKTESPTSDYELKAERPSVSEPDVKNESPAGSSSEISIKKESSTGSNPDIAAKDESPVVSYNGVTVVKAEDGLPEPSKHSDMNTDTSISDKSESEIKVDHEEAPALTLSPSVHVMTYHRNADIYVRVRKNTEIGYGQDLPFCTSQADASAVLEEKFSMDMSNAPDVRPFVTMMDEDDSPAGLNIVFSLLHYKYHELRSRLSMNDLYGLAQVVEKYKLPQLLVPFAERWLVQDLNYRVIMAGDKLNNERVMLLTWIFGEGRWFSRTLPKVAWEATLQGGTLMGTDGPFAERIPAQLIDVMAKHRYNCLQKLRQSVDQPLQDLIKGSRMYCRSKDATPEVKEACNFQQLGGMIAGLTAAGLIPFPTPETYKGSVIDMVKKLETIRSARYKVPGVSPHLDTHHSCGIRHLDAVKSVLADPIWLTDQVYNEFKRRGEKTGVFSLELYNEIKVVHADDLVPIMPEFKADADHFAQEGWETAGDDE
ncbi:hypothetical protein QBC36DRAFT_241858 [Triangularia setosa]|uniref:Uncharacterized protein n=1 Tax=Triangularia setosa TaxID=2587417 RepID=A0AAN6W4W2_9PEZI|nr:hypothetical protein QBC36DRAFT_241858 [Podospora setosa]